eukprot:TRINITY_DN3086_c0_g1_i4.p2 TRINITY_DN3086_c0_g1~~TRINITY_DN3086_c0_g1_i4.p2  ORF type:complete len:100 (-),score=21.15 TRINITY_DN3086_c0_g1_i4:201-500(-)
MRERLWSEQLALKERKTLAFFPTVLLNGELMNANKTLVQDICALLTGTKPAGCPAPSPPSPPPTPSGNPCAGHRCDDKACPCGCECGNKQDPGLCYQPS